MKKAILGIIMLATLAGCGQTKEEKAQEAVDTGRKLLVQLPAEEEKLDTLIQSKDGANAIVKPTKKTTDEQLDLNIAKCKEITTQAKAVENMAQSLLKQIHTEGVKFYGNEDAIVKIRDQAHLMAALYTEAMTVHKNEKTRREFATPLQDAK
jgi:hypothetical protein